jgi:hypothetical protein
VVPLRARIHEKNKSGGVVLEIVFTLLLGASGSG